MQGVVVIGGHVQGLGIIRSFGRKGINCMLLDENVLNIARHSKYCDRFLTIPPDGDPIPFLLELSEEQGIEGWLIIPTDDKYVKILSENKDRLLGHYCVSVDDWDKVKIFYNKRDTYELCDSIGIEIPKTHFPRDESELIDLDVEFPCIIKPAVMHTFYEKMKKKVLICKDWKALTAGYREAIEAIPSHEIMIQEIIPGDSSNQYSAGILCDGGLPIVTLHANRKRQIPPDFGKATTFAETVEVESMREASGKLLGHVGYDGICEVEFKRDPRDGSFKLLEVNPRTWKWHSIAEPAGVDFLSALYDLKYGGPVKNQDSWNHACWRDCLTDSYVLITTGEIKECMQILLRRDWCIDSVFSWDDPLPFIVEVLMLPFLVKR